jgi:hypothetical protein
MNPFLTVPMALPGDAEKGNEDKVVNGKILPGNVIAYHEGFAWGTFIYLTTGQAFCLTCTVPEYEEMVRKYWLELGKRAAGGKIKLLQ